MRATKTKKRRPATQQRSVYIMMRIKRTWYGRLTGQRQYKIGISKAVDYRRKMIQEDIGDSVIILQVRMVGNARKVEKKLHHIFSDSKFTISTKGMGQAGATEWFYLTMAEYACLEYWLWRYALPTKIKQATSRQISRMGRATRKTRRRLTLAFFALINIYLLIQLLSK